MQDNRDALAANPYPGRGIVLGLSEDGDKAVQAYWVMGRSENSRNRILVRENGTVRTEAFDSSKVEDPSLIIYNAMRTAQFPSWGADVHVVSNGDQTDTVRAKIGGLSRPKGPRGMFEDFVGALLTREFEPDAPNFTPRITGMIALADTDSIYGYSIICRNPVTEEPEYAFSRGRLDSIPAGAGICFHTYEEDGDPLPAFKGSPYAVPVGATAEETAESLWEELNPDNRVSLVVKTIGLAGREAPQRNYGLTDVHIINKLQR